MTLFSCVNVSVVSFVDREGSVRNGLFFIGMFWRYGKWSARTVIWIKSYTCLFQVKGRLSLIVEYQHNYLHRNKHTTKHVKAYTS